MTTLPHRTGVDGPPPFKEQTPESRETAGALTGYPESLIRNQQVTRSSRVAGSKLPSTMSRSTPRVANRLTVRGESR